MVNPYESPVTHRKPSKHRVRWRTIGARTRRSLLVLEGLHAIVFLLLLFYEWLNPSGSYVVNFPILLMFYAFISLCVVAVLALIVGVMTAHWRDATISLAIPILLFVSAILTTAR